MSIPWRAEIEKELRGKLSDRDMQFLNERRYLSELDSGSMSVAEVAEEVRVLRDFGRPVAGSDRPRTEHPPVGWQRERVQILAQLYEAMAEQDFAVRKLRRKLDGSTHRAVLTKLGLPIEDFSPPGRPDESNFIAWIVDQHYEALGVEPGDDEGELRALAVLRGNRQKMSELWYSERKKVRRLSVPTKSILGEVAELAAKLEEQFHWDQWDATRWIVCGGDPPLPHVFRWRPMIRYTGRTDTTTRLLLEVDPTLSRAEVAAAYGRARAAMFTGERLRPLEEKALALARFYTSQPDDVPAWEEWRQRWNKGPGRRHGLYQSDGGGPGNFRRDVRSAWRRLTSVGWRPPGQ